MDSLDIEITETQSRRTASATIRNNTIHVRVPGRWRKVDKEEAVRTLVRRTLSNQKKQENLLSSLFDATDLPDSSLLSGEQADSPRFITLANTADLSDFVFQLNAETFKAPLQSVRMGRARYTRLAQVNLKTGVMTVSKYCLVNVPLSALRYLILHELAHFYEANHSAKFWALVARYVPDYGYQSKLIKAFHQHAVSSEYTSD